MIGDIVTRYRSRGLRGAKLREALRRHAAILQGCDPGESAELYDRAGKRPVRKPMRRAKPATREVLDPERAVWLEHDRRMGLV